jgi:iron complex outermembrane receptor protein
VTDFNAQAIVTNPTSRTEGIEAELRWVVNDDLVVTGGWTNMEVIIVEAEENGGQFGFFGADDITGYRPDLVFGGSAHRCIPTPTGWSAGWYAGKHLHAHGHLLLHRQPRHHRQHHRRG